LFGKFVDQKIKNNVVFFATKHKELGFIFCFSSLAKSQKIKKLEKQVKSTLLLQLIIFFTNNRNAYKRKK